MRLNQVYSWKCLREPAAKFSIPATDWQSGIKMKGKKNRSPLGSKFISQFFLHIGECNIYKFNKYLSYMLQILYIYIEIIFIYEIDAHKSRWIFLFSHHERKIFPISTLASQTGDVANCFLSGWLIFSDVSFYFTLN